MKKSTLSFAEDREMQSIALMCEIIDVPFAEYREMQTIALMCEIVDITFTCVVINHYIR